IRPDNRCDTSRKCQCGLVSEGFKAKQLKLLNPHLPHNASNPPPAPLLVRGEIPREKDSLSEVLLYIVEQAKSTAQAVRYSNKQHPLLSMLAIHDSGEN